MAVPEHIERIRKSVSEFNRWRAENANFPPGPTSARRDLGSANLSEANLSEANLSEANLSGADLRGADLREADLS
jgi:uncharacterized protein YjbI with pentapeptide repeats